MPLLLISSPWKQTGKTSLAVNLAWGLASEGNPVWLFDCGLPPGPAVKWIKKLPIGNRTIIGRTAGPGAESGKIFWQVAEVFSADRSRWVVIDLDGDRWDLLMRLVKLGGYLLVTVPLAGLNLKELLVWEQELKGAASRGISLVVPARVNVHHWAENEPAAAQLLAAFSEESVADPLPY